MIKDDAAPGGTHATLWGIQCLRGIAATMVVFHHSIDYLTEFTWSHIGATGVDIFFVISGFVMAYSCARTMRPTGRNVRDAADFLMKRFIRVIPLYWFALALAWRAEIVHGALSLDMLKDFLFIPRLYSEEYPFAWPQLVPGWTINYEVFFYLLLGISLLSSKHPLRMVLIVLCALTAVGAVTSPAGVPAKFYTSTILLEFGYGILLYFAFRSWPRGQPPAVRWAGLIAAFGALAYAATYADFEHTSLRFLMTGIPAAAIVWFSLQSRPRTSLALLGTLGDASYSIYLFHITIGFRLSWHVIAFFGLSATTRSTALVMLAITMTVCVATGLVLYRFLERPLTAYLRSWSDRRLRERDLQMSTG